ncbi:MAG TPA: hypothetical protein PLE73_09385 [Spirochaetota bacterium]|nr:hypothetical protein [Spirochaetota bacterium]HPU88280.1 hypothetical protein [Spirochaetota bacterium]
MDIILLIGAGFNIAGGIGIFVSQFVELPYSFPRVTAPDRADPPDYMVYRLFTVGTAFSFGALYLYLFFHRENAYPFLIFGMALKYWAFLTSLIAYRRYRIPAAVFFNFGLGNLAVGILFSAYLLMR